MILVSFTAAFVNPYSDEQALATEYVAALFAEAVGTRMICFLPKVTRVGTEPIEDSMYEQMMRSIEIPLPNTRVNWKTIPRP